MPYSPINTGTAANDGTGTPIKTAFDQVNAMLSELYGIVGGYVSTGDFTTAIATLGDANAALSAVIAGKADAGVIAGKANASEVLSFANPQALNSNQRMRLADNAGNYASLHYEVLPDDLELGGDALTYKLPKMPNGFVLKDARLLVDSIEAGEGANYTASLTSGGMTLASVAAFGLPDELIVPLALAAPYTQVPAHTPVSLTVSANATGDNGRTGFGIMLWLRGVWIN